MIDVLAIGAVSPLGLDEAAWSNGPIGAAARSAIARDPALEAAGLRKPFAGRVMGRFVEPGDGDPATAILLRALAPIEAWISGGAGALGSKGARIGVAIGTSSGAMSSAERFFAAQRGGEAISPALARDATYHAPFRALLERLTALGIAPARRAHLLTACSSSTLAIGLAMRWLALGECDLALAGGYDALTTFVAAGFEALGATTGAPPPRPSRVGRDGMSLGEGAALFVLARAGESRGARGPAGPACLARLAGFGASGDAVHLTAPDRTGGGLARAAEVALADGGVAPSAIGLASVHGTSTAFNDPMEAKALARALSPEAGGAGAAVAIQAAKATIGHTLGAAGALETALVIDAIRRGVIPATPGEGELDPEAPTGVRARNEAHPLEAVLKLSSAFGGANAALVVVRADAGPSPRAAVERVRHRARVACVREIGAGVDLAQLSVLTGIARDRLPRMDATTHLALAAVGALAEAVGRDRLGGAGLVIGTCLATIDVNALYDEGLRRRGAAHAEGRRFAYTTPNAAAGECAIAFGLTGPNLAVGRGEDAWDEAEEIGRDLIAAGDAERLVVVGLEAEGPMARLQASLAPFAVRFGARAMLLERDA
jgi:3-oxoacyl-[acyl-carrier-protein] synthase-1/3-oxoacyl-[acyl-carrier-protein] synthase II